MKYKLFKKKTNNKKPNKTRNKLHVMSLLRKALKFKSNNNYMYVTWLAFYSQANFTSTCTYIRFYTDFQHMDIYMEIFVTT